MCCVDLRDPSSLAMATSFSERKTPGLMLLSWYNECSESSKKRAQNANSEHALSMKTSNKLLKIASGGNFYKNLMLESLSRCYQPTKF